MPPSNGHQILVWSDLSQEPRRFGANEISSQKDDTLWKLPSLGSVAAMAVAYKGVRSAVYWVTEGTIHALRTAQSPALFALFRWLKLPILNSSFRALMQEAVAQVPAEFVRGWLGVEALPYGLVHRQAEQGLDTVIREFLWNHMDRNESRMERLARAFPSEVTAQSEGESFKSSLSRLGEICPSLSYNLAKYKLRGDKYRKYVHAVAAAKPALIECHPKTQLTLVQVDRVHSCYRAFFLLSRRPGQFNPFDERLAVISVHFSPHLLAALRRLPLSPMDAQSSTGRMIWRSQNRFMRAT